MAFPGSKTSTPRTEFVCADKIDFWFAREAARCAAISSCLDSCLGLPSSAAPVSELMLDPEADSRCKCDSAISSNGAEARCREELRYETARRKTKIGSSGLTSSKLPNSWAESTERRLLSPCRRSVARYAGGRGYASMTLLEGDNSRSIK